MLDMLVAACTPELAYAVARALALEPRDRYESAREMGRAIGDGALGIASAQPPRAGRAAAATQATTVLAGTARASDGATRREAVVPRQPRRGPARQPAARPVAAAPRRASGSRRLTSAILALLALAGVIAAIVVLSSPAPTKVTLRNVFYNDVQESAEALRQLVGENTK